MWLQVQSLLGLIALPLIGILLSERRAALFQGRTARLIVTGLAIQIILTGALLNVPALSGVFDWPARGVDAAQEATLKGVQLVFGYLAGAPAPFDVTHPENGFVLALQALPLILLISVISKILYHWGVLQKVVALFAWALARTMGVSGPVGTSAAANIFVGMVEAPLLVKPYLAGMSRGGLFATMTVGMAGVAGTVLAIYASILKQTVPGAAGHLIIASIISVPAALVIAELMVPDDGKGPDGPAPAPIAAQETASTMDAIAQGTQEGLGLVVNVAAMLIVAVALVALVNMTLTAIFAPLGVDISLERCLGFAFAPLAWLLGIPATEVPAAASLLGVKTILNEFVAYLKLGALPAEALSPRSRLIMTYALCGFANFGSLGIMVGGLVAMVPERRIDIVALAPRTIVSGTLATLMTAAVVGLLSAP